MANRAEDCFEVLTRLSNDHVGGYMFMYNMLTPKWLGSEEVIQDFCEMATGQCTQHPLLTIIPLMHMVECYTIWREDEDEQAAAKRCKQDFLASIIRWKKRLTGIELHPSYLNLMNSYFAFLFHICGQVEERNKGINLLNSNIPLYPWGYMGITDSQQFWKYKW